MRKGISENRSYVVKVYTFICISVSTSNETMQSLHAIYQCLQYNAMVCGMSYLRSIQMRTMEVRSVYGLTCDTTLLEDAIHAKGLLEPLLSGLGMNE